MSTIKVNKIENTSTTDGGISIDNSGHVTVDGQQLPTAGALSSRNLIVNGAMQVSQRATSVTSVTASNYITVDRFKLAISNLGTWTVTQESDGPDGFSKSFKALCTTANASPASGNYLNILQRVEAQNLQSLAYGTSSAKALTLSFYVKSNKTGNASVNVRQQDNSNKIYAAQYSISSANTWERKTISIPADTSGVINDDNGSGLQVEWWMNSGSDFSSGSHGGWKTADDASRNVSNLGVGGAVNDYFQITGIQLEVGSAATPFEHRSYSDELFRCQRYCYRVQGVSGDSKGLGMGLARNTSDIRCVVPLPTTMRANAQDVTESGLNCMYRTAGSNVSMTSSQNEEKNAIVLTLSADSGTPFTAGDSVILRVSNSDTAFFQVEAEL